jgi:uncharacterized membrane protein
LVLLSAVTHAYWNFLLKRSGATQAVVGLSKIVEAAAFAIVLLTGRTVQSAAILNAWTLPVVGAFLVLLNYLALSAAYRSGDLSLVYPIARGAMLVFLPPLAFLTIGERLQPIGWTAIAVILGGIAALRGNGRGLGVGATSYALLAAFTAACYTIWDKHAIQILSPLAYYAAYSVIVGMAYAFVLLRTATGPALRSVWQCEKNVIVQVGALNSGSYLLALAALQTGQASYVIAVRQLSIAVGALLGWRFLGESLPPVKLAGVTMVVAGCILIALTR